MMWRHVGLAASILMVLAWPAAAAAYRTAADYPELSGFGPVRWRGTPIRIEIDPSPPRGLDYALWRDLVSSSAEAWQIPGTTVRLDTFVGGTPPPRSGDGRSSVRAARVEWRELGLSADITGITDLIYVQDPTTQQWRIVEADILLNDADYDWSASDREVDIDSALVHELGHFLGMAHNCETDGGGGAPRCGSSDDFADAVMFPLHQPGRTVPGSDDVAGIEWMYGSAVPCEACATREICIDGACVHECARVGCATGELCTSTGCVATDCGTCDAGPCVMLCDPEQRPDWGAPCVSSTDCSVGVCHPDGYCTRACADNAGCPDGWRCGMASGACEQDGLHYGDSCEYSSDCITSHCIAVSGLDAPFCSLMCVSNASCPGPDVCLAGTRGSFCAPPGVVHSGCSAATSRRRGGCGPWALLAVLGVFLHRRRAS